jgi:hypothetical protein
MAAELMLINPRRKRRGNRRRRAKAAVFARNPRRRRRSRRRMTAKQARYFGGGRRRRRASRVVMASNPRRRRRRSRRRSYTVMRRNPRGLSTSSITNELMAASIGAAGAVALDYLFTNYAPASLQVGGMTTNIAQLAGAVGLGMVAGMIAGPKTGAYVGGGAMTVTVFNIVQQYMTTGPAQAGAGQGQQGYGGSGQMGRYIGRVKGRRMGWVNPARLTRMNGMGRYVGGNLARFQ